MKDLVTILIPSHNRHAYLDRILDYYHGSGFRVIVADSTDQPYRPGAQAAGQADIFSGTALTYLHVPGISLPGKLDLALQQVQTPYTVMCADDDFLIADGIAACLDLLQQRTDLAAVQGNSINYGMSGKRGRDLDFRVMYPETSLEIGMSDPLDRIERLFADYKSFFYAVYRTAHIKTAFHGIGRVITNLYLNEYVTGIVPLALGKYMEIPVFYQVREHSENSDDKRTPNLGCIFDEQKYSGEREAYINFLTAAVSGITGKDKVMVHERLLNVLLQLAARLRETGPVRPPVSKRVGAFVAAIPLIGPFLIEQNRRRQIAAALKKVVKSTADRQNLTVVGSFIKKYQHAIR